MNDITRRQQQKQQQNITIHWRNKCHRCFILTRRLLEKNIVILSSMHRNMRMSRDQRKKAQSILYYDHTKGVLVLLTWSYQTWQWSQKGDVGPYICWLLSLTQLDQRLKLFYLKPLNRLFFHSSFVYLFLKFVNIS